MVTQLYAAAYEEHMTDTYMSFLDNKKKRVLKMLEAGVPDNYGDWNSSKFADQCPNGFKRVATGHSLGGPLATMHAYCQGYTWYSVWHKTHKTTPWPEWFKWRLFFSGIYSFGAPPTGNGELINFANFAVEETVAIPDMCWPGQRTFWGGAVISDPIPDTYCCQNNDPIPAMQLTDMVNVFKKTPCYCPSVVKPGADHATILSGAGMCMGYAKYSLGCPHCDQVFADPRLGAHVNLKALLCGTNMASKSFMDITKYDPSKVEKCQGHFNKLYGKIVNKTLNMSEPCKKTPEAPKMPGPMCQTGMMLLNKAFEMTR